MNCCQLGYLMILFYIIVGNNGRIQSRQERSRKRKALAQKQHLHTNGWGFGYTHAPEPDFVGGIPGIKVIAGKDAILRCVVENLGDYKVSWSVINPKEELSIGTHVFKGKDRIHVTTLNHTSWYLHIKNVTQNDTGYYACQISTNPIKSQAGHVEVVEPPEFVNNMTNRNVTVLENSNVTLSCKATGNPTPVIKWRREDDQEFLLDGQNVKEYTNHELQFIRVHRDHMAAYLCLASNEVPPAISRRFYLDVKFPPLIWIHNQFVGAVEGTDVYLECNTEAHPVSENYWIRDDEIVASKTSRYYPHSTRNAYKIYMKLIIRNLQPEDYGFYHCVAKNEIGETEGTIKLYKPTIPTPYPSKPVTEELLTFPTRKVITVALTTEYRTLVTEVIRKENMHTPGKQQKYGHGRSSSEETESQGAPLTSISVYVYLLSCLHILLGLLEIICR